MFKKEISYVDYDGVERKDEFLFNISKAELIDMEMTVPGGMDRKLKAIIASKDSVEIYKHFRDLIIASYGVKSPDGKRFMKSKEITDDFIQSEAYSELMMEIMSDETFASDFVNGIIPKIPSPTPIKE